MDEVVNEGLIVGEAEVDLNMPDPPRQVDFEDENGQDGAKAMEYSRTLVMEFNPSEVEFWFMQIENEMYTCEVKSQWLKRSILVKNLPPKIQNDVKTLLTIKQSQAPADIYKKIKQEVLRIHAPRKEDKFKKAFSRVLTGLPSQLGQTLITDVCVNQGAKLVGCCCAHIVYTLWTLQLPVAVRSHVADMTFSADTYQTVFESADKVFLSTKPTEVSAVVASVSAPQADSEPAQSQLLNQTTGARDPGTGEVVVAEEEVAARVRVKTVKIVKVTSKGLDISQTHPASVVITITGGQRMLGFVCLPSPAP